MLELVFAALVHADVLISAGHEGRPASCASFPTRACNLGASGERDWTPVVADEATRILRAHGLHVIREPADFDGRYAVGMAIFIHFDGAVPACTSGASIGYHRLADRNAAELWRALYAPLFPFRFMPDNFTVGLHDYYAFGRSMRRMAPWCSSSGKSRVRLNTRGWRHGSTRWVISLRMMSAGPSAKGTCRCPQSSTLRR